MKVLSIRQPWAWLICAGMPLTEVIDLGEGKSTVRLSSKVIIKNIENRNRLTNYRGRIYVHASKRDDSDAQLWLMERGFAPLIVLMLYSKRIPRGAIIGEVSIVDCVTESKSPWFVGPYGYVLANPVPYQKPIPCRGKPGFFEPDIRVVSQ